jgi:parvulin-like peptidyl-prolyl isomerase
VRQIHARHILVAWRGASKTGHDVSRSREKAQSIARSLHERAVRNPASFCELALRLSDDPNNRTECGDLGWLEPGQLTQEIEAVLFRLKPGEISPVVESPYGFHVFKRE